MSKEGNRDTVLDNIKVRSKLKPDAFWLQQRDTTQPTTSQEEKPWVAEVRARRLNGAPTSPISSPVSSTPPPATAENKTPTQGYLIRGVFTKVEKPASPPPPNGISTTRPFSKKPSESYKLIAPHTVRSTSQPEESLLSPEEQEKRREAASSVLQRSSVRQRSYVLSAAKKYEAKEASPDPAPDGNSLSFVAERVEVTEEDCDNASAPAPASSASLSPAGAETSATATPKPTPRRTSSTVVKTAAGETAAKVKEETPKTDLLENEEPDYKSLVTAERIEVASSDPQSDDSPWSVITPEIVHLPVRPASPKYKGKVDTVLHVLPLSRSESSEPGSKPVSKVEPESKPESKVEPESKPESKVEPESKPESKVEPESKPGSKVEPGSKPVSKVEPESKPESKVEPGSKPESKVEPGSKPVSKVEPESKPESKVEPESKPESKVEPESKPGSKVEPESKPGSKVEPESKPESKVEPESKPESKVEPESKPESKVEPESKPGSKVEPESKPGSKVEPESKPGSKVEPEPEPELKPKFEPVMKEEPTSARASKARTEKEPAPLSNTEPLTDDLLGFNDSPEESEEPVPPSPGRWSQDLLSELHSESKPTQTGGSVDLQAKTNIVVDPEPSSSTDPFDPYPIGTTSHSSPFDLLQPVSDISISSSSSTVIKSLNSEKNNALEALAEDIIPISADTSSSQQSGNTGPPQQTNTEEESQEAEEEPSVDEQTLIMFERKSKENDSPWDKWTSPTVYTISGDDEEEEEEREMQSEPEPALDRSATSSAAVVEEKKRIVMPEPEPKKGLVLVKEYVNVSELSLQNPRYQIKGDSDYLTSSPATYSYSSPSNYSRVPLTSTCTYCGEQVGNDAKISIDHLNIHCHPACFKCGVCSKPMGDLLLNMFIHGGKVHCDSCYSNVI